jgi:hypothetical protein
MIRRFVQRFRDFIGSRVWWVHAYIRAIGVSFALLLSVSVMSTNPANATATRSWPLQFQQAPSSWLSTLIFNAKAITAVGEALPFPYVRGSLELLYSSWRQLRSVKLFGRKCGSSCSQKVQKNQDELKELCTDTVDIITVVRDRISSHKQSRHVFP